MFQVNFRGLDGSFIGCSRTMAEVTPRNIAKARPVLNNGNPIGGVFVVMSETLTHGEMFHGAPWLGGRVIGDFKIYCLN